MEWNVDLLHTDDRLTVYISLVFRKKNDFWSDEYDKSKYAEHIKAQ